MERTFKLLGITGVIAAACVTFTACAKTETVTETESVTTTNTTTTTTQETITTTQETTTTTAATETTINEETTTTPAAVSEKASEPEDKLGVFKGYLQEVYDRYSKKDGLPTDRTEEVVTQYQKFAIADVDNDNEDELIIQYHVTTDFNELDKYSLVVIQKESLQAEPWLGSAFIEKKRGGCGYFF